MSIRVLLVCAVVLFTAVRGEAKWDLIQQEVTAFDMLPNGVGLLGISPTGPYLAKKTPSNLVGVIAMTSPITDVSIVDENMAFMTVKDSGTYLGSDKWQKWLKIDTFTSTKFLLSEPFATIAQTASATRYFFQGRFYNASGTIEQLLGVDYTADTVLYAVSATRFYRSYDRGRTWNEMMGLPTGAGGSIYIDRTRNLIYVGGKSLHISSDRGQSWRTIVTTSNGDSTVGAVYGTPDCTGTFYIVSSSPVRPEILVSRTQGDFFQSVGFNPVEIYAAPSKVLVYNKGNNIYWLDKKKLDFYYSPDGADGSAIDSASLYVDLVPQKNVILHICREQNVAVGLRLTNSDCISVIVDSIRQTKGVGKLFAPLGSFAVGADAVDRPLNYVSTVVGWDTVRMRAYMHSSQGSKPEYRDFTVIVRTLTDPPDMALNQNDLQYGEVKLEQEKSINVMITNNGCDSLRVDSIKSSWPEVFRIVSTKTSPFKLGKGAQHTFQVVFKPLEEGPFLEAVEIGTNGGHDFISVYGVGATTPTKLVDGEGTAQQYRYYPNPFKSELTIDNVEFGSHILIFDLKGRLVESATAQGAEIKLQLGALPVGSYILQVGDRRSKLIKE